jgi:hypothetical protein
VSRKWFGYALGVRSGRRAVMLKLHALMKITGYIQGTVLSRKSAYCIPQR